MKAVRKKWKSQLTCGLVAAIILLSIAVLPYVSWAQPPAASLNNNSIYDELSGTVVNCILQDSDGFLWFGTQTGLYKYNGYSLKPYRLESSHANQFVSNFITSMCEDNSKNIWLGTFGGGLFKLNLQTEKHENLMSTGESPDSLIDNTIRAICKDDTGRLWIATQKGLDCLEPTSGHFIHYEVPSNQSQSIPAHTVTAICQDKAGILWIGTENRGINKLDPHTGTFLPLDNHSYPSGFISKLFMDKTGILWIIAGDRKLIRLDSSTGQIIAGEFPELKDFRVTFVCEDTSGNLWVGTYGNGVRVFDEDSGQFVKHTCDYSQIMSSCNYRVVCLYGDSSGNLWIGTEGNGINKINTNLNFSSYTSNQNSGIVFSDNVVLSICKDSSGMIWLGTANGGINKFDREQNRISYYKHDPDDSSSISHNTVSSICEDSQGTLWFGTLDGTLNRLDSVSGKFTHYSISQSENNNGSDNGILRIFEDRKGMIWACAANEGLIKLDRSTGQVTCFTNNPQDPDSIGSNHALSFAEDPSGVLWIGTNGGGLNKLDTASNKFTHYEIAIRDPASQTLNNYNINAIVNDQDLLWLATDKGLYKFNKNSGESVLVNDSPELSPLYILGLLKDDRDNLWLNTPGGLMKYNIHSGSFKKFSFTEGLQKNQYIPGAYYQSSDGEMFFGGTNGFSCFYAGKIKDNLHKPPIVITDFKIFDKSVDLADKDRISLTYKDSFISFSFAALDYANPLTNQYAYILEGFDTDWHYSGTRNYASYTNLAGGEYLLRIKAANNDGFWSEQGTQISLIISPPFWRTTWFIMAGFIIVFAALISYIKFRTRSIKRKSLALEREIAQRTIELEQANRQLRHTDEMKSSFLSMVSHEIRTPLSSILGFTELIAEKIENTVLPTIDLADSNHSKVKKAAEKISRDLRIIIDEGDRLSTLVNDLLDISKIESGKIDWHSEALDIVAIINQALLITKPAIENAGLTAQVMIEADLPAIPGNKDMLTQVFINLIANAAKFTQAGYIRIDAQRLGQEVLVSIQDSGVGIPEPHLAKVFEKFFKSQDRIKGERNAGIGMGLYICRQIIEKHRGRIWVDSVCGQGSIFYFTLPLQ